MFQRILYAHVTVSSLPLTGTRSPIKSSKYKFLNSIKLSERLLETYLDHLFIVREIGSNGASCVPKRVVGDFAKLR